MTFHRTRANNKLLLAVALDDLGDRDLLEATITGFRINEGVVKSSALGSWTARQLANSHDEYVRAIIPERDLLLGYCLFSIAEADAEEDDEAKQFYSMRLGMLVEELMGESVPADPPNNHRAKASGHNLADAREKKRKLGKSRKEITLRIFDEESGKAAASKKSLLQVIDVTLERFQIEHPAKKTPSQSSLYAWTSERQRPLH